MTILIPFRVLLPFSLQGEHICFCSSRFNCLDWPVHSGSWQHASSRLSQHGPLPSARSHHQQITLIPQPTAALLRLGSINCTVTSHLGTSSAAGFSTPLHFLFPVKNPFPAPVQDINTYGTQTYFQENSFTFEINPFPGVLSPPPSLLGPFAYALALARRVSLKTLPPTPHSKPGGCVLQEITSEVARPPAQYPRRMVERCPQAGDWI